MNMWGRINRVVIFPVFAWVVGLGVVYVSYNYHDELASVWWFEKIATSGELKVKKSENTSHRLQAMSGANCMKSPVKEISLMEEFRSTDDKKCEHLVEPTGNAAAGDDRDVQRGGTVLPTFVEEKKAVRGCFEEWQRLVVMGDLHGDFQNVLLLLKASSLIDAKHNWIAPPGTLLIQMGDIVDKGPDSYLIFKLFRRLRGIASGSGSKIVQLMGNHEAMNMCGMFHQVHPLEVQKHFNRSIQQMRDWWGQNGVLGKDIRENFQVAFMLEDLVFVHAGILPRYAEFSFADLKDRVIGQIDEDGCLTPDYSPPLNKEVAAWARLTAVAEEDLLGELGPLWTRLLSAESEAVSCPLLEETLKLLNSTMMIVGHTPTYTGRITTRCRGKLVMVDTSISKYMGNNPRLMTVDEDCTASELFLESERGKRNNNNFTVADGGGRRFSVRTIPLFKYQRRLWNDAN